MNTGSGTIGFKTTINLKICQLWLTVDAIYIYVSTILGANT